MQEVKLGVTGHRKTLQKDKLIKNVQNEVTNLSNSFLFKSIISPLADGADRIVTKILIDDFDSVLIVPLPFEKDEYKKDFSEDSKKEFDSNLEQAYSCYEVDSLEKNSREGCYFNVGKEVVDQCDILIALWDGKLAKGVGGTGDIVKYAIEIGKAILHINTDTYEVKKINFKRL